MDAGTKPDTNNENPPRFALPLLIIGSGTMGGAILSRALATGVLAPDAVVLVDPDHAKLARFDQLGVPCASTILSGLDAMDRLAPPAHVQPNAPAPNRALLLAVKPQMLTPVAEELKGRLDKPDWLVLSILAGIPTHTLASAIGGRIVRLMPNTPAQFGKGITALCPGPGATEHDLAHVRTLFASVGSILELEEAMLDAFTAVAGSGPAYIFYLAHAMIEGAMAVGFEQSVAQRIVRETVVGAAHVLNENPDLEPASLQAMVTSQGGTTAAATAVMDERKFTEIMVDAIIAARDRGHTLAS